MEVVTPVPGLSRRQDNIGVGEDNTTINLNTAQEATSAETAISSEMEVQQTLTNAAGGGAGAGGKTGTSSEMDIIIIATTGTVPTATGEISAECYSLCSR